MSNIFVIGIFFSFFLHFLLLTKKKKTLSDKILSVKILVIGINLVFYYLPNLGYVEKHFQLADIIPLLHGPFLYLYVVFSLRKDQQFHGRDYAHFLPAALFFLYLVGIENSVITGQESINDPRYQVFLICLPVALGVSGITYPVLAYRLIGKYEKLIHENFSYDEKIGLNWLKYWILGDGLIFITAIVFVGLQNGLNVRFPFDVSNIVFSEIVMVVLLIGYFGIRHEGIFSKDSGLDIDMTEPEPESKSAGGYKKSGLRAEDAEQYHQRLLQLMEEQKPYLEPKLTLYSLASGLGISVNHLSQLINQYQGKNFYDFINEYRVEEFKAKVASPRNQHLNILAIALDSGFNSKSSFNLVFKKHTGLTPSQFLADKK